MPSGSPEELRDLVLGEGGQRFAPAAAHQREALAALHDLADEVTVDALARERVDDDGRVAGGKRYEERPRRDRAERIETERLAERPALGQHDDPVPVDPEPDARGVGQLDERRRHPALRRVVHGVDRGELARDLDLGEHAEPRRPEEVPGLPDGRRRHASRAVIAAPSSGTPLVSTTASPTRAPPVVTSRSFATSPSIAPTTIGQSRPCVISVWPPTSATSSSSHAAWSWSKSDATAASVVAPGGSRSVARNQRGRAPRTAMSLALTWSAYQPISSVANVIGSVVATR